MIDIKVPTVGESISEVTLIKWLKKDGEYVDRDEVIAELESEKATFEVNAEKAGTLKTVGKEGDTLKIGDTLATIDETAAKPAGGSKPEPDKTGGTKPNGATTTPPPGESVKHPVVQAPSNTSSSNDLKASPVA